MKATFFIQTLGCKLNQFESDGIAARLLDQGMIAAQDPKSAEVLLINTCTVTEKAELKSLKLSKQYVAHRARFVFLLGCAVDRLRPSPWNQKVVLVPNNLKSKVPDLVIQYLEGRTPDVKEADPFDYRTRILAERTRGFLKIQDGCDVGCAYCIVPLARGRAVSRPVDDVVTSFQQLLDQGAGEIVLTGINIAHYRSGGVDFCGLLQRLLGIPGDYRLRLSSLEPGIFPIQFYELMRDPRMARHLHLSLQSGSDSVLERMGRPYSVADWLRMVWQLRTIDPSFHISTDIIVGFPGESNEDFESSLSVLKEAGAGRIHIFPFSPRRGTVAYNLKERLPSLLMNERLARLRSVSSELYRSYQQGLVGGVDRVLVEKSDANSASGWISRYVYVSVPTSVKRERNTWIEVRIHGFEINSGRLEARAV